MCLHARIDVSKNVYVALEEPKGQAKPMDHRKIEARWGDGI